MPRFAPCAIVLIAALAVSCINMGETYSDGDCVKDIQARTVGFANDVQPVLQKYCIGCHSNMADAAAYKTNYYPNSGVNSAYSRSALPISDAKHMPVGLNLPNCKLQIIRKWETDGYAN